MKHTIFLNGHFIKLCFILLIQFVTDSTKIIHNKFIIFKSFKIEQSLGIEPQLLFHCHF